VAALGTTLGTGGVAWGQSLYGPGGLFLFPTANFPARGEASSAIIAIPQESARLGGRRTWVSTSLAYGLSDRWEVTLTRVKVNPGRSPFVDGSNGGSAKYRLAKGVPGGRPDVAVGAGFLAGGDAGTQVGFLALRFSPERELPGRTAHLHVGLFYANELSGVKRDDVAPYGGLDVSVTRNVIAFAEARAAMGSQSAGVAELRPARAFGLLWRPARNIRLVLAMANDGLGTGFKPSVGAGYNIGIRRPR
jgi:hypothetical protein